jgi:predicted metal-dependent peptidase
MVAMPNDLPPEDPKVLAGATLQVGKAKAALILEQPFFATILVNLPMRCDWTIKTMATDGTVFLFNPYFVASMTLDETRFVLCHEVGHCIFQHMFRKNGRSHKRWNQAGDYVINDMLVNEKIGSMPEGGLHNPQLVAAGGNTTEGVYDLLPEDSGGGNGHGDPMDDCRDAPGDQASQAQAEADMKVTVAQAAQAAKMMNKLSAGLQRFVDAALKPKVDWKDVLRRFWSSKTKTETTWAKPKRRWLSEDVYLPSLSGEKLGEFVVFVDCSGSIGQAELDAFAAEIRSIHEDCAPSELHVIYFDSKVSHHDTFAPEDQVHIEPHGGGGTAFSPCIEYLYEKGIAPVAAVFLTDLYCDDFGDAPEFPVLWVSTHADHAPWGEVVMMNPKL